jgi:SPP1 gp7 family putative phage head morphogenesis protein
VTTKDEEQEFSAQREEVLQSFVGDTYDKLQQEVKAGKEQGESDNEVRERVLKAGREVEEGRGDAVAKNEAQSVYGAAQVRALKRAGFATCVWNTMDDDRVRPSHKAQDGLVETIGDAFPNGCRFPGDPKAPLDETINCRCWLTGGERA